MPADAPGRYPTAHHGTTLGRVDLVEAGHVHRDELVVRSQKRQRRLLFPELQVPLPDPLFAVTVAQRAVWDDRRAGCRVHEHRLPFIVLGSLTEVGGVQEAVGDVSAAIGAVALAQRDEHREVGVFAGVVLEVRDLPVHVELFEHNVTHRHCQRPVGAGLHREPVVGELGVIRIVGAYDDGLLALVAGLGHEVGVGGAGYGDVRAPHHQVGGIEPVGGLRHVGLVAPDLGRGRRQVRVPVVEARDGATDQGHETGAAGVGSHAHRRDRREPDHAVRPVLLDRVDVGGGHDLRHLRPRGPHEPTLTSHGLIAMGLLRVLDDGGPGVHRVARLRFRLAVHLKEHPSHIRVLDADGRVRIPGERGAPRTATRFVLWHIRAV
ncbi:hypothetical protein BH23ACT11_BH23ACT11_04810 [soil metagenome]